VYNWKCNEQHQHIIRKTIWLSVVNHNVSRTGIEFLFCKHWLHPSCLALNQLLSQSVCVCVCVRQWERTYCSCFWHLQWEKRLHLHSFEIQNGLLQIQMKGAEMGRLNFPPNYSVWSLRSAVQKHLITKTNYPSGKCITMKNARTRTWELEDTVYCCTVSV